MKTTPKILTADEFKAELARIRAQEAAEYEAIQEATKQEREAERAALLRRIPTREEERRYDGLSRGPGHKLPALPWAK